MEIITPTSYAPGRSRSPPSLPPCRLHPLSDPMRFLTRKPTAALCSSFTCLLVLNPLIMRARAIQTLASRGLIADDTASYRNQCYGDDENIEPGSAVSSYIYPASVH